MPDEVNLVDLEQSRLPITNPFKFNFRCAWGKKPFILPGDGVKRMVNARLRDHIARHLEMKIYHQYHDAKVLELKKTGKPEMARQYRVPSYVRDRVWFLITGEPKYREVLRPEIVPGQEDDAVVLADLGELEKTIQSASFSEPASVDIVSLVESQIGEVTMTPTADGELGSGHTTGSVRLPNEVVETADTVPVVLGASGEASPAPLPPVEPGAGEFPSLPKDTA